MVLFTALPTAFLCSELGSLSACSPSSPPSPVCCTFSVYILVARQRNNTHDRLAEEGGEEGLQIESRVPRTEALRGRPQSVL